MHPAIARLEKPIVGAWLVATAIVVGIFVTELTPVVSGTGADARWDWSFLYVTSRYVVLPLACVFNLWLSGWAFVQSVQSPEQRHVSSALASSIVPLAFLLLSYFYPLPWSSIFAI